MVGQASGLWHFFFARARGGNVVSTCGGRMSETDTALVARARDGDRAAFEQLVRRTSRLVYARLYLDTGRADGIEDLLQETYLLAFRSLRTLADPAGFRPWLLTIAHNVLIDNARRSSRQKRAAATTGLHLARLPSPEPPPDEAAERAELRQRVLCVLRSLPPEYQLPLTLRYITGADYAAHRRATWADERLAARASSPRAKAIPRPPAARPRRGIQGLARFAERKRGNHVRPRLGAGTDRGLRRGRARRSGSGASRSPRPRLPRLRQGARRGAPNSIAG